MPIQPNSYLAIGSSRASIIWKLARILFHCVKRLSSQKSDRRQELRGTELLFIVQKVTHGEGSATSRELKDFETRMSGKYCRHFFILKKSRYCQCAPEASDHRSIEVQSIWYFGRANLYFLFFVLVQYECFRCYSTMLLNDWDIVARDGETVTFGNVGRSDRGCRTCLAGSQKVLAFLSVPLWVTSPSLD
jgi:hypothetical protein